MPYLFHVITNRILGLDIINVSCSLACTSFYRQVTGPRGDDRTLQELQQHVHSEIPEQITVLLLVLIIRGFINHLMTEGRKDHHDLVYVGQYTH